MRKVVQFMHVSLDGFVAGPNGEMDWIIVDEDLFDYAGDRTDQSDAALYGKNTYMMMDGYWPTAADQPDASKHDKQHSAWYKKVDKYVLSHTLQSDPSKKLHVIGKDLVNEIEAIKKTPGKEIVIFGSPSAGHSLAQLGLVDEYWLFINPVLLGKGVPMFKGLSDITKLKLQKTHAFANGVVCLYYSKL
ncbi:MAG: dihydrofolate reductase family protein [Bacteroidota bacterium]